VIAPATAPREIPGADPGRPDSRFLRFWSASTVSAAGSALTTVALPIIAVQQLGASPAEMGLLFAAASAASLLARLPAATWADRSPAPLRVVARGQLLSGGLIASVPGLAALGLLSYASLIVVVAAAAATSAVVDAFAAPTVPRLVPRSEIATAYGRFSASRGGASVAGPAIAGVLLQLLAAPLLLLLDALSFVVASVLTSSVRLVDPAAAENAPSPAPADLWAVFRVPFLRRCLLVVFFASLANGAVSALLVLFMLRQLELPPSAIGIVLGAGAVGGVAAGISIGLVRARLGASLTAGLGGALMVVSLAVLPLAEPGSSGAFAGVAYELIGNFGATLAVVTIVSEIPVRVAPRATARAIAIANIVPEVAAMTGALAGGALASIASVRATLWRASSSRLPGVFSSSCLRASGRADNPYRTMPQERPAGGTGSQSDQLAGGGQPAV